MEIRRVEEREWRELRALRLEALREAPDAFWLRHDEALERDEQEWREFAARPGHVAVEGGRFVGMVAAWDAGGDPDCTDVVAVYVSPPVRGRGLGAALVEAQLGWARSAGFRRARLQVNLENASAARLYARLGFRDTGGRSPLRDGPQVLAEMVRELGEDGAGA